MNTATAITRDEAAPQAEQLRAFRRPEAGPIPLYHQIEQNLRERIANAEFKPDEALPPEDVLARQYEVSRVTLRRALDALIESRLISRRRGIGTFVSRTQGPPRKNVTLVGRLDDAFFYAERMSYKLLSRRAVPLAKADPTVVAALQITGTQQTVDCLEVVALTGDEPYAYSEFYFPDDVASLLSTAELAGTVPILRVVEAKTGQRVSWADQIVEPVMATGKVARHLGITRRPILQMRRTYHTADGRPLESVVVRYHPERYAYSAQLLAKP